MMVIPAQALCLLPMCHQFRSSWKRTVLIMTALNTVSLPLAAFVTWHFSLDINYVLLPLLLVFFGFYQFCLKCPVSKSLSTFLSVCALMAILCNLTCAIEASMDPSIGADTLSVRSALLQLGVNALAAGILAFPFLKYGSKLMDQLNLQKIWYMTIPFSEC